MTTNKTIDRVRYILNTYRELSPEHTDPVVNLSTVAGDLIAEIQFVMSEVYQYPRGDVESVRIAALNGLRYGGCG